MNISLANFEHQIEEKILKRGFDYFKKGCVTDVDEVGGGNYEITVEGSETYTVSLHIKGDTVSEFECDCPYDMGPVCKHVAATLFYLQKESLETIELPVQKTPGKQKEMSASEQTKQLLKLLSHDALLRFVQDTCAGDSKFRQLFVAKHIHLLYPESKEMYTKQVQALIKTYSDKYGFVSYRDARRYRQAQKLMLALIKKTENNEVAERFIEQNLSNPQFRVELIEKYLKSKDYLKVESLAYEGIAQDEKEAPGLADDWRNYLLTLYQQIGDTKNTIKFARYFLVHSHGGRYHPLKYYYDLLKSLTPKDQWTGYLDNIIVGIKSKSRWNDYDRISQLYVWEAQWDKLFELLRQNVSFERIAGAEQYLSGLYSKELATLYQDLILFLVERNMGRSHYQTACRYIRRMIKLGAKPMADALIIDLKQMYPSRRALIEELNNV